MPITGPARAVDGFSIASGNIVGQASVNKFGRNIEIDSGITADIWDGGHTLASGGTSLIWVAPTQARIHNIVSDSANDDGSPVGTGAQTVKIYGLTGWGTAEVNETITMNGVTPVATANSYVIIHRMECLNPATGATTINDGTITATAQTDSTVTAIIRPGVGQTGMAIYGVPSTQTAYIGLLYANLNKIVGASGGCTFSLLVATQPDQDEDVFTTKHTFSLQLSGTSNVSHPFWMPKVVAGPAIIKVQAVSGANDMDVSAGFDLALVDN